MTCFQTGYSIIEGFYDGSPNLRGLLNIRYGAVILVMGQLTVHTDGRTFEEADSVDRRMCSQFEVLRLSDDPVYLK